MRRGIAGAVMQPHQVGHGAEQSRAEQRTMWGAVPALIHLWTGQVHPGVASPTYDLQGKTTTQKREHKTQQQALEAGGRHSHWIKRPVNMCQRQHMNMSIAGHFHVSAGFLLMMWCDGGGGGFTPQDPSHCCCLYFQGAQLYFDMCQLFWHWFSLTTSVSVTMKVWRWFFYPHNKAVRADISTGSLHRTCLYCRGKPHRKRKLSSTLNLD